MCSVLTKTLLKGKAANILRECSNPTKPAFGDAQAICVDLVNHFEDGANARMGTCGIEKKSLMAHLNHECAKTVTAFVNHVAMLVCNHKDAVNNTHDEE